MKVKKSFYIDEDLVNFIDEQTQAERKTLGFELKPSQFISAVLERLKKHKEETNENAMALLDRCCDMKEGEG